MSLLSILLDKFYLIIFIYLLILFVINIIFTKNKKNVILLCIVNNGGLIGLSSIIALSFLGENDIAISTYIGSLIIEIILALFFVYTGLKIIDFLRYKDPINNRYIIISVGLKVFIFLVLYVAVDGQYGIFANSSRIEFLLISPALSKLRYIDAIIDFILCLAIFMKFIKYRSINLIDIIGLISVVLFGFLTGSKGGSLMTLLYGFLICLSLNNKNNSIFIKRLFIYLTIFCVAYVFILSISKDLSAYDMFEVILIRFILNADARIMAFDPGVNNFVLSNIHGNLLEELFRGPSMLIGSNVAEFPLGVYQYMHELGVSNYTGATNQLSAIFATYGPESTDCIYLAAIVSVFSLYMLTLYIFLRFAKSNFNLLSWFSISSIFWLNITITQGFDAFVQLVPITYLLLLILYIFSLFVKFSHNKKI